MAETGVERQAGLWSAGGKFMRLAAMAGALLIAGCQSLIPRGEAPPSTAPTPTEPGPIQPGLPTDAARHRVALLVPMSGTNANVGRSIANATTLALLDTKTQKLRITTYDTNSGTATAAQRAIADGNKLILGPLLAENVREVAPVARKAGVPIISFSNDVSIGGNGVFLMGYNPAESINRVLMYAKSKGMSRFAGLVPRGTYGERAATALLRGAEAAGGTVVSMQTFDRSASSITSAIKKLPQDGSYDAILIADSGRVAIQAAPLIRSNGGGQAKILGTELWNTESNLAGAPALRGAWFASVSDGLYRQLAAKYRARYGETPFRLAALGYDAVLLTVRVAQDWRVGTPFPARKLIDESGFSGIDGAFRFERNGIAQRALEVQQINPGSFAVIDPAPRSFTP